MEARGRISIPVKIRELLNVAYDGKLILSCGFFEKMPHILIVPLKEWERFESRPPMDSILDHDEGSFLMRLRTIGSCEEVKIDEHGRIVLPDFMREYANLGKELVLVGLGNYMAIFSPDVLSEASKNAEKNLGRIRESLTVKTLVFAEGGNISR